MTYGLPYMGSKNKIAEWVVSHIPNAENFYDLCCGGCAITHAAMLSHKFKKFIINDIQGDMPQLFIDAIQGKYQNESRWISREDFFKLKDTDAYIRCLWSFGNKGATYIYGKSIEDIKHAFHLAIFNSDNNSLKKYGIDIPENILEMKPDRNKYLAMKKYIASITNKHNTKSLDGLKQLESFGRLDRLNRLQSIINGGGKILPSLYKCSYIDVPIKHNSVIYIDLPYNNTGDKRDYKYCIFDYEQFYSWCERQAELVVISEYSMPEDSFVCIAEILKKTTMSPISNSTLSYERLFVPKHQIDMYNNLMKAV